MPSTNKTSEPPKKQSEASVSASSPTSEVNKPVPQSKLQPKPQMEPEPESKPAIGDDKGDMVKGKLEEIDSQLYKEDQEALQRACMRKLLADLANKKYQHVVVMAGAGISTAAGIPDFRSPKTGLYVNLQRFNLPYPEAVFDIDYLRDDPEPFSMLCSEMYPTKFKPTRFHYFIKWISDLGVLKRVYTQNIDTLERMAGIPPSKIVEAHGSFSANYCVDCKTEADKKDFEEFVLAKRGVYRCHECDGIVKPEIVFFGESLPERFFNCQEIDFNSEVDLVIVAGTSLQVTPFNQLPDMVPKSTKRYLINLEPAGSLGKRKGDEILLGRLEELDILFDEYFPAAKITDEEKEDAVVNAAKAAEVVGKVVGSNKSDGEKIEPEESERASENKSTDKSEDKSDTANLMSKLKI